MRIITMVAALLIAAAGGARAESGLPFQDFNLGLQNLTIANDSAGTYSSVTMNGLALAFNGSWVDTLLNGQDNTFRIGDYVGGHVTLSRADYLAVDSQYFVGLGLALGAQAGVEVTDYLAVGARYYADFRDNKIGSLDHPQALQLNTGELMLRLANLFISGGVGSGKKARGDETYRSSIVRVRYLFSDGGYAGVMVDNLKIKYALMDRDDTISNVVVQFGIMH